MKINKNSYDILRNGKDIILIVNVTSKIIKENTFFKYKSHLLLKIDDDIAIQYENIPEDVWKKIIEKKVYFIEFGPLGVISETLILLKDQK